MPEPAQNSTEQIADYLIRAASEQAGKAPEGNQDVSTVENEIEIEATEPAPDAPIDEPSEQAASDDVQPESEESEVSLKDLAEMLDVPVKEIYGVKLPIGNGETVTLGQFKDTYKRLNKIESERESFDEHRRKQENEILVARRQTEDLVNMLIDQQKITPKDLEAVENINRARMIKENKAILAVIPSWQDQDVRQADFDAFVELGAEYGFSDVEIRNIPDHRILKMLYDFSAARRHAGKQSNGKTPPKQIGGQQKQPAKVSTLAQRKREAKRLGGAVKRQLQIDMITGKQPLE